VDKTRVGDLSIHPSYGRTDHKLGLTKPASQRSACARSNPKRFLPPSFRLVHALEGNAMIEQSLPRERLSPMGTFQCVDGKHPVPFPLSALSGNVALITHDLRLPLAAILANAEFLAQSSLNAKEREELYQEIRLAVDRMNEMVSSLAACAQDAETLRPARRNIVETVTRAIRMTSVRQEFRRISITHHHQGLATGWFDSDRFERVVSNLILNACEAVSPESGQIVVSTTGNRARLQIAVWDNGPGIPAAIRNSVFQPFVSYGKTNGSGLGLAIAKKIVEDHGGNICLDQRREVGTLFMITIPFDIPRGTVRDRFTGPRCPGRTCETR